jgi:hypothetical protein
MNSYTTRLAGKELKPMVWRNNRLVVSLSKHGKVSRYLVYRLVAGAFCEQPVGYDVVMHLDNDPTNNHYTNLRWGTHQQNTQQAVDDGLMPRGAEVHNSKLDEEKVLSIRRLRKSGAKLRELAESFSVSEASCSNICNHKVWRHVA